jgi:hypothetical protein
VPIAPGASKEAKRLAAVILEVLAGVRTLPQAAETLGLSQARYYQIEARAFQGLLEACEPRPKGRQADPLREMVTVVRENERLRRELGRQQSLVRLTQRSIGLNAPVPSKETPQGKKSRKRRPMARALSLAKRLQQEAADEPNVDRGVAEASNGSSNEPSRGM